MPISKSRCQISKCSRTFQKPSDYVQLELGKRTIKIVRFPNWICICLPSHMLFCHLDVSGRQLLPFLLRKRRIRRISKGQGPRVVVPYTPFLSYSWLQMLHEIPFLSSSRCCCCFNETASGYRQSKCVLLSEFIVLNVLFLTSFVLSW